MSEQNAAARPIRRRVTTEEVHEGPVRAHAYVCEAASCMSLQAHDITVRLGEAVAEAGVDGRRRQARGLHGPVRSGSTGPDPGDGAAVQRRRARGRRAGDPGARGGHRFAGPPPAGPLLRAPAAGGHRELRRAGPREPRGLRRAQRVRGAPEGALGDDLDRGARRDHEERPPGPRRRRLPDRPQVDDGRQGDRHARSTSSATRTRATRARSWTAPSSRATRSACSRAWRSPPSRSTPPRATSTAGRSTRSRWPASGRPSARRSGPASSARGSPTPRSRSTSRSASAPAPSCAARRRR